jgi:hypothetical protein
MQHQHMQPQQQASQDQRNDFSLPLVKWIEMGTKRELQVPKVSVFRKLNVHLCTQKYMCIFRHRKYKKHYHSCDARYICALHRFSMFAYINAATHYHRQRCMQHTIISAYHDIAVVVMLLYNQCST